MNADNTETTLYIYVYDEYNQLQSVTDGIKNTYTIYSYDESGNILNITTKNCTGDDNATDNDTIISSINYLYNDSEWKDLLTSYNGQTITYDAIGNPLTYRDGITLTWQNGRELATYSDDNYDITYTYDASGMRTGKTVTNSADTTTSYTYVYENGQLLQMCMGSRIYDFSYDANGTPVSVAYRTRATATPTYYYYAVNSRGDITALHNGSGSIVAVYEYDAYGKLISVENATGVAITSATHIANMNPLRYRGYVYDSETGFYYLQTRYYDPVTCRFINEDGYCSTGQGITGNNMFAYCNNNPVIFSDPTGTLLIEHGSGGCAGIYSGSSVSVGGSYTPSSSASAVTSTLVTTVIVAGGATAAYNDLRREMFLIKALERACVSSATSSTTKSKDNRTRAVFPQSPHNFHPKGLELFVAVEIGNPPNGGIYKWRIPGSKVTVFEWNEDFIHGSHYHTLMVEWDSKHIGNEHYRPGDLVPEPWNTTYFGE